MTRVEATNKTSGYVSKTYTCKTQEYLMLEEIAKSIAIIADNTKPENESDWFNDWTSGHETAKEEIKEWCYEKITRIIEKEKQSSWTMGYKTALIDVIEYIERI